VVYVLPEKVPHPMAKNDWQYEQELNAEYVLLTRAKKALYFIGRLICNLTLPADESVPTIAPTSRISVETSTSEATEIEELPTEAPVAMVTEAKAIVAVHEEKRTGGGRPRKQKERLQIKVSGDVAVYLRSLKGGGDGYSGYLEALIRSDPQFALFAEQTTLSLVSCV
jgi:ATP-dependent exoDNAse (exonuclease V) beta subunit